MNTVRTTAKLFMKCSNWSHIASDIKKYGFTCRVHLRNGLVIEGPEDSDLLDLVNEIFLQERYCCGSVRIEKDDTVVDVGANIGVFTCYAALRTRNWVYAIEPYDQNLKVLEVNVNRNNLRNVRTVAVGLAERAGTADLYIAQRKGGCLLFDHNIHGKLHKQVTVEVKSLGQVMDDLEIDRIDFLKIDCEGSEGFVFKSIPSNYLSRIRKIAMEFHDNVSELKHGEIMKLLENNGFETNLVWDGLSPFGYIYASRR